MPVYGILPDVADDRWLEIFLARGKSEHRKATCLVKTRVPGYKSRVTESVTENKPPSTISGQWSVSVSGQWIESQKLLKQNRESLWRLL